MILYAESSAILAWLLVEPESERIALALRAAEHVLASDLLLVECDRACIRAATLGALTPRHVAAVRAQLGSVAGHWEMLRVSAAILERSRQPFPIEPVRSLDAIHLASALQARAAVPEVKMLSLDRRVRDNAVELGFELVP